MAHPLIWSTAPAVWTSRHDPLSTRNDPLALPMGSGLGELLRLSAEVHLGAAGGGGRPAVDFQLAEDVPEARFDGAFAYAEVNRDGLVGLSLEDQPEHGLLPGRECFGAVKLRPRSNSGEAAHHLAGNRAVEREAPSVGVLDRPGQVLGAAVLEDVAAGPGLEHARHVVFVLGDRKRKDGYLVAVLENGLGGADAIHLRHRDIHQDHGGPEALGHMHGLASVHRLPDDADVFVLREHAACAGPEDPPVIDDEHPDEVHHRLPIGTSEPRNVTRAPPIEPLPISIHPPSSSARSRMPISPNEPSLSSSLLGSTPTPSSSTCRV